MPSPSQTLKNAHRKQNSTQPLKLFAHDAMNDKQLHDVATAWQANKKGPEKKAAPPPRKPEPVPPVKAPPRKR